MLRLAVLVALVLAAPALADGGPGPGTVSGGDGVGTTNQTILEAVQTSDGRILQTGNVTGNWGIPAVAYDGVAGGLSRNNSTLVLEQANVLGPTNGHTTFQIVNPKVMGSRELSLKGNFTYDALSPNGSMLYLVDHVSATNGNAYQVRAYDLWTSRLLPRVIADRTQRSWTMQGIPVVRTVSPNDRFVYTLYENPGGYPFVHELDTVRAVAHCIGLPYLGKQVDLTDETMVLVDGGRKLAIGMRSGTSLYRFEVPTYRAPATRSTSSGFPWWWVAVGAGAVLAVGFAGLSRRPRRRAMPA
jgi:hypothetical protein